MSKVKIRLLFEIDNDQEYVALLLLPGQQAVRLSKIDEGFLEAFIDADDPSAFHSGVSASALLTPYGMTPFWEFVKNGPPGDTKEGESMVAIQLATGNAAIAVPPHIIKNITATRWQETQ